MSKGKFLEVFPLTDSSGKQTGFWITEAYHLYKENQQLWWSRRDIVEFNREREQFIALCDDYSIKGMRYLVRFACDVTQDLKLKIITNYANHTTERVDLNE